MFFEKQVYRDFLCSVASLVSWVLGPVAKLTCPQRGYKGPTFQVNNPLSLFPLSLSLFLSHSLSLSDMHKHNSCPCYSVRSFPVFFCFLIFLKSLFFPISILSQILITISLSLTLLADKELLRMRFIPRRRNKREEERERKCQSFSGKREREGEWESANLSHHNSIFQDSKHVVNILKSFQATQKTTHPLKSSFNASLGWKAWNWPNLQNQQQTTRH